MKKYKTIAVMIAHQSSGDRSPRFMASWSGGSRRLSRVPDQVPDLFPRLGLRDQADEDADEDACPEHNARAIKEGRDIHGEPGGEQAGRLLDEQRERDRNRAGRQRSGVGGAATRGCPAGTWRRCPESRSRRRSTGR